MLRRTTPWHGTALAIAVFAAFVMAVGPDGRTSAHPTVAGGLAVGTPLLFPSDVAPVAIACAGGDTCYVLATRDNGFGPAELFTLSNDVLSGGQPLGTPAEDDWENLACLPSGTCFAVGANGERPPQGLILTIASGIPAAAPVVEQSTLLSGIACVDAATCYAVGGGYGGSAGSVGAVVPIVSGSPGEAMPVPGTAFLFDVDCATASTCYAVGICSDDDVCQGSGGAIVPIIDGQPGSIQPVGDSNLTAIACASAGTCYASGALAGGFREPIRGAFVAISGGRPGAIQTVDGIDWLHALACPTHNTCLAFGGSSAPTAGGKSAPIGGAFVPLMPGGAGAVIAVEAGGSPGAESMKSVACPGSGICYAITENAIIPVVVGGSVPLQP